MSKRLAFRWLACLVACTPVLPAQTMTLRRDRTTAAKTESPGRIRLAAHTQLTRGLSVTISGTVTGATTVEVTAPLVRREVGVRNGAFALSVPLATNRVNAIHFTGLAAGQRGPTTVTRVTQDVEKPDLFLDGPGNGDRVFTSKIDVFGRVADRLSGYSNLEVTVNDVAAEVSVGVGTNGTFFARNVPLIVNDPPEATEIRVFAKDALGNTNGRTIFVTCVKPPRGTPRIEIVDGNAQTGPVRQQLPQPLRVRCLDGRGQPFAKKLVTFEVVRNDGLLVAAATEARLVQVRTDDLGIASVRWRLGNEAGAGNHRVLATALGFAGTPLFCATGTPGPAAQINVATGQDQTGQPGGVTPEPLRVWLHDGCNGLPGVDVTFRIKRGTGKLNGARSAIVRTSRTGHAAIDYEFGDVPGRQEIEATFVGNSRGPARFRLLSFESVAGSKTTFTGRVLDNAQRAIGMCPVVLDVAGDRYTVMTTTDGSFSFDDIRGSGPADLLVDAFHATQLAGNTIPKGTFPNLLFHPVVVAEAGNRLGGEAVRIPPLSGTPTSIDNTRDVTLRVQGIDGLEFRIKKGSLSVGGVKASPSNPITVSLSPVHFDEIPMPAPNGAAAPFAWTFQPAGAAFDPPVEIRMPNMAGLAPGALAYFLSFDHDTNQFEIAGSGSVDATGTLIVSDPGSGIAKAGWGSFCPPYPNVGSLFRNLCGDAVVDAVIERLKREGRTGVTVEDFIQELVEEGCGFDGDTRQDQGQPDWSGDFTEGSFVESGRRYEDAGVIRPRFPSPFRTPVRDQVPPWLDAPGLLTPEDAHFVGRGGGLQQWWHQGAMQKRSIPRLRQRGWSPARIRAEQDAWIQNAFRIVLDRFKTRGRITGWVADAFRDTYPVLANHHVDTLLALAQHLLPLKAGLTNGFPTLPAPLTATQMTAPSVSTTTLDVTASTGFFVNAGTGLQLRVVRRRDSRDLTLGSTGTRYFATDGDQVFPVTADGLVDVGRTSSPLPNVRAKLWVLVQNGSDVGGGQFGVVDVDTDNDLIVDSYERLVGLDPTRTNGADNDSDGDGLRDLHECVIGTSPISPDTDGDGVRDGPEVAQGSDPHNPNDRVARIDDSFEVIAGAQRARTSLAGSFELPNVPVPASPVRCYYRGEIDGETMYGASEYLDVIFRGAVETATLTLSKNPIPTPATLSIRVADPVLNELGQRTRVTVTGRMSAGPDQDLTRRARGTSYRVSNPNVVNVDPDGFVTARGDGIAFVTASNEGTSTVATVLVSLDDPLTTVEGFVRLPDRTPVVGASVFVEPSGLSATTDADGRYQISGVPTALGDLTVTVQAIVASAIKIGLKENLTPLPGMITDAGVMILEDGVYWRSDQGGVWTDASKWSIGRVPGPSDLVVIDRPNASIAVRIESAVRVRGLFFSEEIVLNTGSTLTVDTPMPAQGLLSIRGGTLAGTIVVPGAPTRTVRAYSGSTLDRCRFVANLSIEPFALVRVQNGLVLDGTASTSGSTLEFPGDQSLTGSGRINVNFRNQANSFITASDNGTLTIGPDITIVGSGGDVGTVRSSLNVQGRIEAGVANRTLAVRGRDWRCSGVLAASNNGNLVVDGDFVQTGSFENNGGTVRCAGTVDLAGRTIDVTGALRGSRYENGTFAGTGSLAGAMTLEDITLNIASSQSRGEVVRIEGSRFTLNGRITLSPGSFVGARGGMLQFTGNQTFDGTGEVVLRYGGAFGDGQIKLDAGARVLGGPGLTIRGAGGILGPSTSRFTNAGTILAEVSTRTIFVSGSWTNTGTLRVENGAMLNFGGDGIDDGGIWNVAQGSLSVSGVDFSNGTTTVRGSVRATDYLRNGHIAGTGQLTGAPRLEDLRLGIPLSWSSGSTVTVKNLRLDSDLVMNPGTLQLATGLHFDGTQTVSGSGRIRFLGATGGGKVWTSTNGAIVTLGSGITVTGASGNINANAIVVLGTLECTASGAQINCGARWTNRGTLRCTAGTLNMSGDGINTGSIDNSGGSVVVRTVDFESSTVTVTGQVEHNGGTLSNGRLVGSGNLRARSAILDAMSFAIPSAFGEATFLQIRNGLTLDATMSINGGSLQNVTNVRFEGAQTLAGTGTMRFDGNSRSRVISATAGLTIDTGITLQAQVGFTSLSMPALTNKGTLRVQGATARMTIGQANRTHRNEGSIDVAAGRATVQGDWTNTGSWTVASGATLTLNPTATLDLGNRPVDVAGRLEITQTIRNGTITGAGHTAISGTTTLDAMRLATATSDGTGVILRCRNGLVLDGTLTLRPNNFGASFFDFQGTQSLTGTGTVVLDRSPCRWFSATLTIGKDITFRGSSGSLSDNRGALVVAGTVHADISARQFTINTPSLTVTAEGRLRASNGGTLQINSNTDAPMLSGTIDAAAGSTVQFGGSRNPVQLAGLTRLSDATLRLAVGGRFDVRGGDVSGTGTIFGAVDLAGRLLVGGTGSAGRLRITEDFSASATARVELELGGTTANTQYDVLACSKGASLGGTVDVKLIASFTPVLNDLFDPITWSTRTGTFSSVQLPTLGGGLRLEETYETSAFRLTTTSQ